MSKSKRSLLAEILRIIKIIPNGFKNWIDDNDKMAAQEAFEELEEDIQALGSFKNEIIERLIPVDGKGKRQGVVVVTERMIEALEDIFPSTT